MHFEKDVFISYAHLDNRPLPLSKEGWVSVFDKYLRGFLSEYLGRDVRVWRDPRLESNSIFADEILENLLQAAALVVVLSPRYIQSEWCRKELKQFRAASQQARLERMGNLSRVFKVEKLPVGFEDYPPEFEILKQQLSCRFFDVDTATGKAREFRIEFGEEAQQNLALRVSDLAHDIVELLKGLERYTAKTTAVGSGSASSTSAASTSAASTSAASASAGSASAPRATKPPDKTVYLATTASDLKEDRENIRRELEAKGYSVLPTRALPVNATDLQAQVCQDLAQCSVSIHLVGREHGFVPEGTQQSAISLQAQLAIESSQSDRRSRLVWLPPTLKTCPDERQQALIDQLKNGSGAQQNADVLQVPLETLKAAILDQLKAIANSRSAMRGAAQQKHRIYLDFDRQDLVNADTKAHLKALYKHLKKECQDVYLPDKREAVLSFVDERLMRADGVLVFWGHGDKDWLKWRWQAAKKAMGYAQNRSPIVRGIYAVAPQTALKDALNLQNTLGVKNFGEFSPDQLRPFFQQLNSQQNTQPSEGLI